jgi:hypothetical protein
LKLVYEKSNKASQVNFHKWLYHMQLS